MEEKQLRNLQFLRLLGAFSVVREKPRESIKSIDYAVKTLSEKKNRTLLIFPQGEILHNDIRPMRFFNGLSKIIENIGNCLICSAAIRYEFLGNYKPEIFISIGKSKKISFADKSVRKQITRELEKNLTNNLDSLKTLVKNNSLKEFENIL